MAFNLDSLMPDILERIAGYLHWRDLLALERVCRILRTKIVENSIWARVGHILVYYSMERPLNLLSVQRAPDGHILEKFTTAKLNGILERCAGSLHELDLAKWRLYATEQPIGQHLNNQTDDDDDSGLRPRDCLWHLEMAHIASHTLSRCHSLRVLDLSGIPLSGVDLVCIGHAVGHTLSVARFAYCFEGYPYFPFDVKCCLSPAQFSEFLTLTPHLHELDLAYCGRAVLAPLSFAHICVKLRKLFATQLNAHQMLQVATRCPALDHVRFVVWEALAFTQAPLDALFRALNRVEYLRISLPRESNFTLTLNRTTSAALRKLRIMQQNVDDANTFVGSLLRQPHPLPRLEQLYVTCSGEPSASMDDEDATAAPPLLTLYRHFCGALAPNIRKLTLQYCQQIDDEMLANFANNAQLEELFVTGCPQISWRALADCVEKCPNLCVLGDREQMTDELLEFVQNTMQTRHHGGARPTKSAHAFHFIRNETPHNTFQALFVRQQCVQSTSQNMHPWMVWAQEPAADEECWTF